MVYFKMVRTPKYEHTTGTLYAHIRHTAGTSKIIIWMIYYTSLFDVPDVCAYL